MSIHGGSVVESGADGEDGDSKVIVVMFDEDDKENPMNWSKKQKWTITVLLNVMTLCIGLSTSAYSSGIGRMTKELGVSQTAGQVGMFMFNAACAVAPLFFAPLCELTGRRYIYVSAFGLFTAFTFMLVFGQNLATQLIGRMLQGASGSIGTILVGGTFSDMFNPSDRSVPMSIFTFIAIFSTIAAPLYSGYIDERLGWRWIQRIHIIFSGCIFLLELLFLRESRGSAILTARAKRLRKETGDQRFRSQGELERNSVAQMFRESSVRAIYLLVREPVVFFFGLWISFAWGIVFLFLSVIPITFQDHHGWGEGKTGLAYIGLIVGCFLGFATGFWQDSMYEKAARNNGGVAIPEARLYGAMVFGPLFPIGIMIYAWTQFGHVHWIAPIIALVLIILGIYHVFLAVYNYTSDAYADYSSSAIAGQGFMRNMFGAVTPLFASQMFRGMGSQWAGLMLAMIGFAITPLPFILFAKGETIRSKSKYAAANTGLAVSKVEDEEKKVESN
ncbi:MFS general substrate transporter [Violaceomyces palustris]|uniref:MFS general substrate transporter n=1 Tax=Violaceomyces palustris TaxID=1673888 RepID=A0ACD0NQJ0_9BASI|nr:MFS general substrate transporter [Violaceomyces palustris]